VSLLGALWIMMYFYSVVGVQIFGGKIYEGNAMLTGTAFEMAGYHAINFNDVASGIISLWCLLIVNDW
jgi:hypothetical protein